MCQLGREEAVGAEMAEESNTGEVAELRALVKQQTEKINQLMAMLEAVTCQRPIVDPPVVDPPPPPPAAMAGEGDWYEESEHFRAEIHRIERERAKKKKAERERIETIGEMKEKMEKLEKVVQKSNGIDSYLLELEGLFEGVREKLPSNFKMPVVDKFDGTGNPKNHVRMCIGAFQPHGLSSSMMAILFQQTLTGAALSWYFTLEPYKTRVWEEVVKAFITQYEYNQGLDVTVRDLEMTRQEYKESFAEFLAR